VIEIYVDIFNALHQKVIILINLIPITKSFLSVSYRAF